MCTAAQITTTMSLEDEKRSILERKRNILMLLAQYLSDCGLPNTVAILHKECGLLATSQREYTVCDNVDLESIYLDHISYNQLKFGRAPRILKRSEQTASADRKSSSTSSSGSSGQRRQQQFPKRSNNAPRRAEELMENQGSNGPSLSISETTCLSDSLVVSQLANDTNDTNQLPPAAVVRQQPLLRDHPNFALPDWAAMAATICRDTVDGSQLGAAGSWDRLHGNEAAKERLIESVIAPLRYAQLYATAAGQQLRPWKCLLLYGPPGTGKTSLARALCQLASADRVRFFNVPASTLVSKWRGESEKMVRILFEVARYLAPAVVFLDEVEGVMSRRDCGAGEHEATKRFKNELLTQLDGLEEVPGVCVLGCTNLPWDIDAAFLRRFERKILLHLPTDTERSHIIRQLIPAASDWTPPAWERLAKATQGFSGDDLRIAHKEAAMRVLRQMIHSHPAATTIPSLSPDDLLRAIGNTKPNSMALMPKYLLWANQHGCE